VGPPSVALTIEGNRTKIAHETRGGTIAKNVRDAMTEDPRSIGASASLSE
jgi:hypothetical protein